MQEAQVRFHKSIEELRTDTGEEKLNKAIAHIMGKTQK